MEIIQLEYCIDLLNCFLLLINKIRNSMAHLKKIEILKSSWDNSNSNLVVVGVYDDKTLTPIAKSINELNKNLFDEAIKIGDVKGKKGETHLFYIDNRRVLLLGLGSKEKFDTNEVRLVAGNASRFAIDKKIDNFLIECFSNQDSHAQAMGEGLVLGSYQYFDFKTDKDGKQFILKNAAVIGCESNHFQKGVLIGQAVCMARDLGNSPGNVATPSKLANVAKEIAEEGQMKVTIFDREEFTKMGMGGLAGVSIGTDEPPKFIILEYMNDGDSKPKVLVGKGLTFDSGGISIKPAPKMDEMKYDMCGSAVVLGIFKALALLKPKINVVGIIPSTENLSGGKAYKPGDVLTAYNGKTMEIFNTDAEGRVILSDGLSYASKHYDPEYILDFATLTGAVVVALGHIATGVMGTNADLMKKVKTAANASSEKVWELPLWDEYCKQVQSDIADVKNVGAPMQAGTIAGAAFLKEFVKEDIPWVHFDIAGTAWGVKPNSINPKGSATGWGIRLVLDMMGVK